MAKSGIFFEEIDRFVGAVREFAQDGLGCGCPEHVFDQIRVLRGEASPGLTNLSVVVGERLLILFGDYAKLEPFDFEMPRLILSGITYRDSIGLNRLRIVLTEEVSVEQRAKIESELKKYDDRVHVHYMGN